MQLIHYVNLDGRVNALYSTPSIYAAAKLAAASSPTGNVSLPLKTDDFFPCVALCYKASFKALIVVYLPMCSYADGPHSYWTGYFTSRPALKGYVRDTSSFHQAARQLQVRVFVFTASFAV